MIVRGVERALICAVVQGMLIVPLVALDVPEPWMILGAIVMPAAVVCYMVFHRSAMVILALGALVEERMDRMSIMQQEGQRRAGHDVDGKPS